MVIVEKLGGGGARFSPSVRGIVLQEHRLAQGPLSGWLRLQRALGLQGRGDCHLCGNQDVWAQHVRPEARGAEEPPLKLGPGALGNFALLRCPRPGHQAALCPVESPPWPVPGGGSAPGSPVPRQLTGADGGQVCGVRGSTRAMAPPGQD